jgi:hypothetical protein
MRIAFNGVSVPLKNLEFYWQDPVNIIQKRLHM